MKLKIFVFVCGLISAWAAFSKDVDLSIDNGPITQYELKNLGIAGDGAITVNVVSKGVTPTDPTYSLNIIQSTGGTISVGATSQPLYTYTCTGGNCPTVELNYTLTPGFTFGGWGGDCAKDANKDKCSLVMNAGRTVSATFTSTAPPPSQSDCKPEGTTIVDIQTGLPETGLTRTEYRPTPSTVYAFAFRTKPAGEVSTGRLTATKLTSSQTGKLIVISECRGDVSTTLNAEKTAGCVMFGSETAVLSYIVNITPKFYPLYWCNLKPNTQYYLNVIGRSTTDGPNLCTDTANCGFSFMTQ